MCECVISISYERELQYEKAPQTQGAGPHRVGKPTRLTVAAQVVASLQWQLAVGCMYSESVGCRDGRPWARVCKKKKRRGQPFYEYVTTL